MDLTNFLSTIPFFGKLIEVLQDKPNLVLDKNIEGIVINNGEKEQYPQLLEIPLRISNIGKRATTINHLQIFILDEGGKKRGYGPVSENIDKKVEPGESFTLDIGYKTVLPEKSFAKILLITPHKKWVFQIPMTKVIYMDPSRFIEEFNRCEELEENFRKAMWDELK